MQMQWFDVNSQMCYRSSVVYIFRRFNFSRFDSISNAQDMVLVVIGTDNGFILAYGVNSAIHRMYIFLIPVIITTNGSCAHSLKFLLSIFLIRQTTDLTIVFGWCIHSSANAQLLRECGKVFVTSRGNCTMLSFRIAKNEKLLSVDMSIA